MGAHPIGSPGCPELALFTPSIERKRMAAIEFDTLRMTLHRNRDKSGRETWALSSVLV
jgi:hypothetical protein